MPRKSRIDAPGSLHHIIVRGIERGVIFLDEGDCRNFLSRLSSLVKETGTSCCAWALIPNHFHLLLKTGRIPIAQIMRRLLTGYALFHNRRHARAGHLFQNRYKSILCQEDAYFLELVRYIHLNPLRSGIVSTIDKLDRFPYCGHGAIVGKQPNDWQDAQSVLALFAAAVAPARRRYKEFVAKAVSQGRRDDLTGGGLVRSVRGWEGVEALRRGNMFQKSDERILGNSDFVEKALAGAQEQMERRYRLKSPGFDLQKLAERVSQLLAVDASEVFAPGKQRKRSAARSLLCYWAARELNLSQSYLSQTLRLSPAGIAACVQRGEKLARDKGYSLEGSAK